jgi:hypothetical protein
LQKRKNMEKISSNSSKDDLRRAISMDEMLVLVKKHIHELYQKRNYESKSKSVARDMEILQRSN